ncbi:unnamed protein product [Camellia sinensis]
MRLRPSSFSSSVTSNSDRLRLAPSSSTLTLVCDFETDQLRPSLTLVFDPEIRPSSSTSTLGFDFDAEIGSPSSSLFCPNLLSSSTQRSDSEGSDLWKDKDRFKKFAHASLELCKVYMEIFSCAGSRQQLFAAEMHLKNIIKQAGSFSDMEEFTDLQASLDEVRMKLQTSAPPSV